MKTIEATGKKPGIAPLIETVNDVKNLLKSSYPTKVKKYLDSITDEYADIVPKVNDLMYELGWSPQTRTFDTATAAKLFTSTKEATKRNFIKKMVGIDKNLSKYQKQLIKWGKRIQPSKLDQTFRIGLGAALGSSLAQRAGGKLSRVVMEPTESQIGHSAGIN